jgi:hypothetical protein
MTSCFLREPTYAQQNHLEVHVGCSIRNLMIHMKKQLKRYRSKHGCNQLTLKFSPFVIEGVIMVLLTIMLCIITQVLIPPPTSDEHSIT